MSASAEDRRALEHCLDQLSGGHRQVVHLTFFQGCAYPEIANILEVPEGTVKTRMLNAKKQLFRCMSDQQAA